MHGWTLDPGPERKVNKEVEACLSNWPSTDNVNRYWRREERTRKAIAYAEGRNSAKQRDGGFDEDILEDRRADHVVDKSGI